MKKLFLLLYCAINCCGMEEVSTPITGTQQVSVVSLVQQRLEKLHKKAYEGNLTAALGFYFLFCASLNPKKLTDWYHTHDEHNPAMKVYSSALASHLEAHEFGTAHTSGFFNVEFHMSHAILQALKSDRIQEYFTQKDPRQVLKTLISAWKKDAAQKRDQGKLNAAIALESFNACITTQDTKIKDSKAQAYLTQYCLTTPSSYLHPLVFAAMTDQDEQAHANGLYGYVKSAYETCTIQ